MLVLHSRTRQLAYVYGYTLSTADAWVVLNAMLQQHAEAAWDCSVGELTLKQLQSIPGSALMYELLTYFGDHTTRDENS